MIMDLETKKVYFTKPDNQFNNHHSYVARAIDKDEYSHNVCTCEIDWFSGKFTWDNTPVNLSMEYLYELRAEFKNVYYNIRESLSLWYTENNDVSGNLFYQEIIGIRRICDVVRGLTLAYSNSGENTEEEEQIKQLLCGYEIKATKAKQDFYNEIIPWITEIMPTIDGYVEYTPTPEDEIPF